MAQKHKTYHIHCASCNEYLLTYYKYGAGKGLLRLYLANIHAPGKLANLSQKHEMLKNVPNLKCQNCQIVIGVPAVSKSQKWVFRLRQGYFRRKLHK